MNEQVFMSFGLFSEFEMPVKWQVWFGRGATIPKVLRMKTIRTLSQDFSLVSFWQERLQ